ncbi:MAG: thioredoxin family protein [Proteobacteria bacterium]|nr:thioredoxin family protein [Pseudomonadota bacterium]
MAAVTCLNATNYLEYMKGSGVKVLRFWATWCPPCRALGPIYDELAKEMSETAAFADIDIDKAPSLASIYGIRSVPTVVIVKEGKVRDQIVGVASKGRYIDSVKKLAGQ